MGGLIMRRLGRSLVRRVGGGGGGCGVQIVEW